MKLHARCYKIRRTNYQLNVDRFKYELRILYFQSELPDVHGGADSIGHEVPRVEESGAQRPSSQKLSSGPLLHRESDRHSDVQWPLQEGLQWHRRQTAGANQMAAVGKHSAGKAENDFRCGPANLVLVSLTSTIRSRAVNDNITNELARFDSRTGTLARAASGRSLSLCGKWWAWPERSRFNI